MAERYAEITGRFPVWLIEDGLAAAPGELKAGGPGWAVLVCAGGGLVQECEHAVECLLAPCQFVIPECGFVGRSLPQGRRGPQRSLQAACALGVSGLDGSCQAPDRAGQLRSGRHPPPRGRRT